MEPHLRTTQWYGTRQTPLVTIFCLGRLGDIIYYESYYYDNTGHVAADTTLTIRFINSLGEWVIYADTTGTTPGAAKTPLGRVHRPTGRAMLRAGRSGNDPLPLSSSRLYIYSRYIYLWRVYRKTKTVLDYGSSKIVKLTNFLFSTFFVVRVFLRDLPNDP